MSTPTRREALSAFLSGVLQAPGTAILASTVVPAANAGLAKTVVGTPQDRANRLVGAAGKDGTDDLCLFANGAFRNASGGGGFKKGGFANGSSCGGGFKNSGFANGGSGGAFKNAGFRN